MCISSISILVPQIDISSNDCLNYVTNKRFYEPIQTIKGIMMIYIHKLLPLLASPLSLITAFLILAIILRRQWPVFWALIILLICSFPLTAKSIWRGLESDYPYRPISQATPADAILVLSGMISSYKSDYGFITEWHDPDRFFVGIELFQAGKAKKMIFTGGKMPWSNSPPEGELLMLKAIEMGIPSEKILLTSIVSNTAEESHAVKKLLEQHELNEILLVTSSFHMPRAKLLFDRSGVKTYPYPTDFRASEREVRWLDYIPSAGAFDMTSAGLREYLGRAYYWIKL